MDRRAAIADAAIALLSSEGSRGLTHRAVDALLALPKGSTSYYFRTREALLAAAAARVVALDRADVDEIGPGLEGMIALLETWLRPANRPRLIARFELFLMAARKGPGPLSSSRGGFVRLVEEGLSAAGVPEPSRGAATLIAIYEGLLLDTMMGSSRGPEERAEILRRVVGTLGDG
ncbi:MAG: TetR/AcrR family transcriptional regulator [Polyangiales bacterium]